MKNEMGWHSFDEVVMAELEQDEAIQRQIAKREQLDKVSKDIFDSVFHEASLQHSHNDGARVVRIEVSTHVDELIYEVMASSLSEFPVLDYDTGMFTFATYEVVDDYVEPTARIVLEKEGSDNKVVRVRALVRDEREKIKEVAK